ncbi:MAG: hypothetical protein J5993_03875 [Clostridia bacterium]|nr:hypothetical protein [Clostridia bacterium]
MEEKRTIKINFKDYFKGFDPKNSWVTKLLEKHYRVEISDKPDYLFFTVFSDENIADTDCVKIFISGENYVPDFNLCDYALSSERIEYGDRHFYYPYLLTAKEAMAKARVKHLDTEGKEKRKFCSFVVSNDRADKMRTQLYEAISAYKPIDSGGRYLNNVGGPVADKEAFESEHKFSLCSENSAHPGYITEKIVQAFAAGTIPIYWGAPDVGEIFNKKAMVFAGDYNSPEEVARRVAEIDADDELYLSMLREPALVNENYYEERWNELERFLVSIIEQPKEKAYRFNRAFWGKLYTEKLLSWKDAYEHPGKRFFKVMAKKFKRK